MPEESDKTKQDSKQVEQEAELRKRTGKEPEDSSKETQHTKDDEDTTGREQDGSVKNSK